MAKAHEKYIQDFLDEHSNESFIGTELADILKQKYPEVTATNCRRIINNALIHGLISSSKPITFC